MPADTESETRYTERLRHVVQGKIAATSDQEIVFTTILGASVFVCLHDPNKRAGGVAHFLFPDGAEYGPDELRFGAPALAGLISRLVELGATRAKLEASVYGGAKMHDGRRDLGQRNIGFALDFLKQFGITVLEQGIGGHHVRRIRFCPSTGKSEEVLLNAGLPYESLTHNGMA